jgi:hypothetical protein
MKMQTLQERLQRDEYEVDPRKVADAIVQRLLADHAGESRGRSGQCS